MERNRMTRGGEIRVLLFIEKAAGEWIARCLECIDADIMHISTNIRFSLPRHSLCWVSFTRSGGRTNLDGKRWRNRKLHTAPIVFVQLMMSYIMLYARLHHQTDQ